MFSQFITTATPQPRPIHDQYLNNWRLEEGFDRETLLLEEGNNTNNNNNIRVFIQDKNTNHRCYQRVSCLRFFWALKERALPPLALMVLLCTCCLPIQNKSSHTLHIFYLQAYLLHLLTVFFRFATLIFTFPNQIYHKTSFCNLCS